MNESIQKAVEILNRLLLAEAPPTLYPDKTGTNFSIYVSPPQGSHQFRVKFSGVSDGVNFNTQTEGIPVAFDNGKAFIPNGIRISNEVPSKRIKHALKWFEINHDAIHEYWYRGGTFDTLTSKIKDIHGNLVQKEHIRETQEPKEIHVTLKDPKKRVF